MPPNEELRADADESMRRMPAGRRGPALWISALAVAAIAAGAWWWWPTRQAAPPSAPAAPSASAPSASASLPASGPAHPLPVAQDTPMSVPDIEPALAELLGARAVASFLQLGDFPRRVAATVDNLGRSHAPSAVWPLQPTPGQFAVEDGPEGAVIAQANAARYAPLVQLVAGIDAQRAAALYRRMYPLLQQAYRELGFGERYFNDRVVEVIDLLLATPEPERPPRVQLLEVKGTVPSLRPWVRYQYVDPQLEALSAGQKILVRVGPANERLLKRKLTELRAQLASPAPAGGTR